MKYLSPAQEYWIVTSSQAVPFILGWPHHAAPFIHTGWHHHNEETWSEVLQSHFSRLVNSSAMARSLRLEFPGAVYHVTSRDNARQELAVADETPPLWVSTWEIAGHLDVQDATVSSCQQRGNASRLSCKTSLHSITGDGAMSDGYVLATDAGLAGRVGNLSESGVPSWTILKSVARKMR